METPEGYSSTQKGTRVGQAIKRIREAKGLSMKLLASKLGLELSAYTQIEADETVVTEEILQHLSKFLGVSKDELLSAQDQVNFSKHHIANEANSPSYNNNGEIERLERLYQEQISLLRDEVSYLRSLLESTAKKG